VDGAQRIHHRHGDGGRLFVGDAAILERQVFLQRHSRHVLHHQIPGAVVAKEVEHRHDAGMIVEAGDGAAFVEELGEAVFEVVARLAAVRRDRGAIRAAGGEVAGEEFLHRELDLQVRLVGDVGDAEAAVAEDAADQIAILEPRARRQVHRVFRRRAFAIAAGRADFEALARLHAAHAQIIGIDNIHGAIR
jgi:hypothetical protein